MPPVKADQYVLDLPRRSEMQARDFSVSSSNRRAVALVNAWPDWPGPVAVIAGPAGCGKTHLLKVWQARSSARLLDPDQLGDVDALAELVEDTPHLGLDAVDEHLPTPDLEPKLFHLINLVRDAGGSLLLTCREAPAFWPIDLRDLITRLRAAPVMQIEAPDDALLAGLLVKLFDDRQLAVDPKLIDWLLTHMERSFTEAHRVVDRLDQAALSTGRKLSPRLAKDVLDELHNTAC
ncbi:MAG: DnaA regulatory inactivator HdaA [Alphaproteobacteria bacterium]